MTSSADSSPFKAVLDSYFVLARFVGDDRGYRLADPIALPPNPSSPCWVKAFIGWTDTEVWIDLDKAYLFEENYAACDDHDRYALAEPQGT